MVTLAFTLTSITILLSVLYFGKWFLKRMQIIRLVDKLPGPGMALPLIGHAYLTYRPQREMMPFLRECWRKYGRLFRAWAGPTPEIHIIEPEHLEVILNSMKYLDKPWPYKFLHPWLGTGLLTSTGEKWHSHRKMITPTFHFNILEQFMDIFVEKSEILVNKLMNHTDGRSFNIYPYINRCALDIICETAMGTQVNAQQDIDSKYVKAVSDISEITMRRAVRPWLHPDFIFYKFRIGRRYKECLNVLHGFTKRVIQERKSDIKGKTSPIATRHRENEIAGRKTRKAFLDLLLETAMNGNKITDEEIQEEVDTFMFEGHDTTTIAMNWTLFLLGNHEHVQELVYDELEGIFQGSDRPATTHDLQNMKYLERVIKESLRLYPSVPFIQRHLPEDIYLDNYHIPAGCMLTLHIFNAHRNPKYFPNPDDFNPDNFLPEIVQKRHPYAYIPFSAGPRNCIGQKFALMEEKTVLCYIIRNYKIRSMLKESEVYMIPELVLRPENGINVLLSPRHGHKNY